MAKRDGKESPAARPTPSPLAQAQFVEKLLVHQVLGGHVVEPNLIDGKVRFRLNIPENDRAIYLIVHVDKDYQTLFDDGIHPDYLIIYIGADGCVWTIVEIKRGQDPHAVDQICTYHSKLRFELRTCLHPAIMPSFQGIIIAPVGTQAPNEKIRAAKKSSGLIIRHHAVQSNYDIRQYVSQRMTEEDAFAVQRAPKQQVTARHRTPTLLEQIAQQESGKSVHQGQPFVRSTNEDVAVGYVVNSEKLVLHASADARHVRVCVNRGSVQAAALTEAIATAGLGGLITVEELGTAGGTVSTGDA